MKKIMVVAPHPDDETLGCAGTLLKHLKNGDEVYWLIVTNGKDEDIFPSIDIKKYRQNIQKVTAAYNFTDVVNLNLPVVRLDTIPEHTIYDAISKVMSEIKPAIIYIPNRSDVHADHQIVFRIMISCTKSFRFPFVEKVYMYETISETDFSPSLTSHAFVPNRFVDVTEFMEKKIEIMSLYDTEIMPDFLPRSIHAMRGLASFRGARISVRFAEAFVLLFEKS